MAHRTACLTALSVFVYLSPPPCHQVRDPAANEEMVGRVCDMGFPEAQARRALASNEWDETAAINALLMGS